MNKATRKRLVLTTFAVLLVGAEWSATSAAFAQGSGNSTVPLARRLFSEGVEAARKSRWDVALDRFTRAYELAPRVKTLFNMAGAQMQTESLLDASESYRRFLRDTRDGRYPDLRADAQRLLGELEKRIPYIRVRIIGLSAGDKITLDDESFPRAGLGESLPINPGSHRVVVTRDAVEIGSRKVTIEEGNSEDIDIVVKPAPKEEPSSNLNGPPGDDGGAGSLGTGGDLARSGTPSDKEESGGLLRSGWFWTAVAVVVVGGAGAGYFLSQDQTADPTAGTLGRGVLEF